MSRVGKDIATLTNVELVTEISRLLLDNATLREGHRKITDGYGPNHMSAFCRDTSRTALTSTGGEHHAE